MGCEGDLGPSGSGPCPCHILTGDRAGLRVTAQLTQWHCSIPSPILWAKGDKNQMKSEHVQLVKQNKIEQSKWLGTSSCASSMDQVQISTLVMERGIFWHRENCSQILMGTSVC